MERLRFEVLVFFALRAARRSCAFARFAINDGGTSISCRILTGASGGRLWMEYKSAIRLNVRCGIGCIDRS